MVACAVSGPMAAWAVPGVRGRVRCPERAKEIGILVMIRSLGVAVLAIATLSACASIDSMIEPIFGPEAVAQPPEVLPQPTVESAKAPPLPRRKPKAVSELTLTDADPQRLVGLDFDGTKAMLGDPSARMDQAPAKVWAYAGGGCMFSVFFYPSLDDQVFRVLAVEVTSDSAVADAAENPESQAASPEAMDKDDPAVRRCFADLLQNQQVGNAG